MTSHAPALHREHSHVFDDGNPLAERNTRWAVILTAGMMAIEIAGGWLFNSMALLADGWHMSSHALALGLSVLAYGAARRLAKDSRFSLGTEDRSAGRLHQRGVVGAGGSADAVPVCTEADESQPDSLQRSHRHRYDWAGRQSALRGCCAAAATTIITGMTTMTIIMTSTCVPPMSMSSPTPPLRCWRSSHCSAVSFGAPFGSILMGIVGAMMVAAGPIA